MKYSKHTAPYWNMKLMEACSLSMNAWQEVLVQAVDNVAWSHHYTINVSSRDLSWARMVLDARKGNRK